MPNPSTLAETEQGPLEPEETPDPAYELTKLRLEMAGMAERAAVEIDGLYVRNQKLAADADAYAVIRTITGLLPGAAQNYSENFAFRLRMRAEQLREEEAKAKTKASSDGR